jgi:ACS family D-galactonate transporter-like MFS transporter
MNRRWFVLGLIFVGILISYVDRGNLSIAAATMMRDFRFTPATMGMLLSAFFWTYGTFQIPAGTIVDRFGIRWVYAGAFLLWSLVSAAIALSRGATDVLVMRMLLGLAEAVGPIASLSFIRQNFSGPEQGLPTATYLAGQQVGPALGALLGTILLDRFGWRVMFAATGLGALLWLPFWLALAPAGPPKAAEHRAMSVRPWRWRALLTRGSFWAMSACVFLFSYYWYFVLTWIPAYLTLSRGFSTLEMGRIFSAPLFAVAVVSILGGSLADRLATRVGAVFRVRVWFAAVGFAGAAALLLLLILPSRASVLPILLFSMCSMGLGSSNYWTLSQYASPQHMVGRTIGYLNTISQAAGAAAPLITGWILGPDKQFGLAVAIAGTAPLLASGCLIVAGPAGLNRIKSVLSGSISDPAGH